MVPNYASNQCILHGCTVVKKNLILLKNVLNESVKMINFIKSCPLATCFVITLFGIVVNTHKILVCSEAWWLSQGAALFQLFELWGKLAVFFLEHHFYLKKKMTDRQTIVI